MTVYSYSSMTEQERAEVFAAGTFIIKDKTPWADRWWGPTSGYEKAQFPVYGSFSTEGIQLLKQRRQEALEAREARSLAFPSLGQWAVSFSATVDVRFEMKHWTGQCAQCRAEFTQTRSRSTYGRWKRFCSDSCRDTHKRNATRERVRRFRRKV